MISLIERGESSPTAVVLEKLAAGLGRDAGLAVRRAGRRGPARPAARWRGAPTSRSGKTRPRATVRRNVSPPGVPQPMQIVEVQFPPGGRVAFENGARDMRVHQQVWVLEGAIDVTLGDGAPPAARRRLPGHAARSPDDVPQPHAKADALCRGDRVRDRLRDDERAHLVRCAACTPLDDAQIDELADVLIDCVEGGASVSFMHPLTRDRAVAFWRRVAQGVAAGERALLVAEDARGLCGTVQLVLDQPENQPHRADLSKMLVHRRARRRGLGAALMRAAEADRARMRQDAAGARRRHRRRRRAPVRAPGLGARGR